jgi:broad-specificity NMP kinase
MNNVFFVIGANGVGKTTTCDLLKDKLSVSSFSVYDFDERGVPDNADKDWRRSETEYWLTLGTENKKLNKNTVVCGFMKPEEIEEIADKMGDRPVVILLNADADTISKRIKSRYIDGSSIKELFRATNKSVEKFIEDNIYYSNILSESCLQNNYTIIETTNKNGAQVAKEVSDFILNFKEKI